MLRKRIFLAIPLDPAEPVAERMKQLQQLLGEYRIKWIRAENFHLTLYFFGEIPVQQIPQLKRVLRLAVRNSPVFTLSLTGPGIFRKGKEPRVLYLGCKVNDLLFEIKKEVDKAVSSLDFSTENKLFRPHVTLGRFVQRQESSPLLEDVLQEPRFSEPLTFEISRLILYESILLPSGPRYQPVKIFPLIRINENNVNHT